MVWGSVRRSFSLCSRRLRCSRSWCCLSVRPNEIQTLCWTAVNSVNLPLDSTSSRFRINNVNNVMRSDHAKFWWGTPVHVHSRSWIVSISSDRWFGRVTWFACQYHVLSLSCEDVMISPLLLISCVRVSTIIHYTQSIIKYPDLIFRYSSLWLLLVR